jgi:O-antigen/teichoic acid export membrane protein
MGFLMFDESQEQRNMDGMEVKSRFAVSLITNILRGALSFVTVLILARGLGPALYGDFAFLMGSFMAIKSLLTLGTSTAFYTFISQKARGLAFMGAYGIWQLAQFFLTIIIIGVVLPDSWVDVLWVGQKKELVLISFVTVFIQQQAWQTMIQIGESRRQTKKIQMMNFFLALFHLLLVLALWATDLLSLKVLFAVIVAEHVVAIGVAWKLIGVSQIKGEPFERKAVFQEYVLYCSPLVLYSLLGFTYDFTDRWMLQSFGGSAEQGLFEVSYRLVAIGLIATTSMLSIFWKEMAEANEKGDSERIKALHTKISRFLYSLSAVICAFLIPWSEEIIITFLGESFLDGVPVLAIMLVFTIYNSLVQINGTLILALGKTKTQLVIGGISMLLSIPVSYALQAPTDFLIPGLELGAVGMAYKMLIIVIVRANLAGWWFSRSMGWNFDWTFQIVSLGGAISLGWFSYEVALWIFPDFMGQIIFRGVVNISLYACLISLMIWTMPWLIGMNRQEIRDQTNHLFKFFRT